MIPLFLCLLAPGGLPTVASDAFSKEQQEAALMATVRIVNVSRGFDGSGAVIGRNGPLVYILTAAHVVEAGARLEVQTFSRDTYPKPAAVYKSGEVIARSKSSAADLALIRLATGDMLPGSLSVCPPRLAPRGGSFPVLSSGCGGSNPPTCEADKVEHAFQVEKTGEAGKALFWRTGKRPVKGRSGGPLVDRQGKLLGICSVASDNAGYYSHLDEINQFLRESGFRWLIPPAE